MQLKPNYPKLYSKFIFPSDDNIDFNETAKSLIDIEPYFNELKQKFKEAGAEFTDEQVREEYLKTHKELAQNRSVLYSIYQKLNYDIDVIKGSPVVFVFDSINVMDHELLESEFPELKKLKKNSDISINDGIKKFLKVLLTAKVVKLENIELDKETVIDAAISQMSASDLNSLMHFIKTVTEENSVKKKSS